MDGNLVTIVKNEEFINIDEDNLRKDDIVVIQAGEVVPADLKLVEARGLEIDEFDVTGEIMPVIKKVEDDDTFLYMGSRITKGAGKGIVVATGEQTEFGNVLKQKWEQNKSYEFRPFEKEYFGLVLLLLPAFAIVNTQSRNHFVVIAIFLIVVTILIILQNYELFNNWIVSNEIKNLERFHIQINDPLALERMNEIDTLCFDKTGVLTTREMNVIKIYYADTTCTLDNLLGDDNTSRLTKLACALCHDIIFYEKIDLANPIDKALISLALNNGVNVNDELKQSKRIYDKPFNSENRYMACGFEKNEEVYYFAKGDPSVILKMCHHYFTASGEKKNADFKFWMHNMAIIDAITQSGGTVIALAYSSEISNETPEAFTFLCLLHLENSLQSGVREVISRVSLEGIRSLLLTGDRDETAAKIGVDCGIVSNSKIYLTGRTIERMALEEIARQSSYCSIFARLLPSQKGLVIRLLQQGNHFVAMVGDGPNDGIALKVANISISFVKNSSPIARRLSNILINDLSDLLRLIEGSNRIKMKDEEINSFRALLLVIIFLSMYMWAFASQYFQR